MSKLLLLKGLKDKKMLAGHDELTLNNQALVSVVDYTPIQFGSFILIVLLYLKDN